MKTCLLKGLVTIQLMFSHQSGDQYVIERIGSG